MVWKNGEIDERELVIFRRGKNRDDGDWFHGLTPATYARHLELVRIALARTGRKLEISEGYGAYRPVAAQIRAREMYGNGAAVPRTSSHGGYWEGRETMAIDYGNWAWVYENHGGRQAFYEDCRKAGLTPGMISRERNYPDEPWHVIDLNPRTMPSFASTAPASAPNPHINILKEDFVYIANVNAGDIKGRFLVTSQGSGQPTALGLWGDAQVNGIPTVDINGFHESFWKTVRLV